MNYVRYLIYNNLYNNMVYSSDRTNGVNTALPSLIVIL